MVLGLAAVGRVFRRANFGRQSGVTFPTPIADGKIWRCCNYAAVPVEPRAEILLLAEDICCGPLAGYHVCCPSRRRPPRRFRYLWISLRGGSDECPMLALSLRFAKAGFVA
jgi:hypothetical protein